MTDGTCTRTAVVEARQIAHSTAPREAVEAAVRAYFASGRGASQLAAVAARAARTSAAEDDIEETLVCGRDVTDAFLAEHTVCLRLSVPCSGSVTSSSAVSIEGIWGIEDDEDDEEAKEEDKEDKDVVQVGTVAVYRAVEGEGEDDDWGSVNGGAEGGETTGSPAFSAWELPSARLDGLWESLEYGGGVKRALLGLVGAGLGLGARGVDRQLVAWNGLVLLHGPPGTGKTSAGQALAQKLAVRLCAAGAFARAELLVVNAHSLFSRWFSESGRLVAQTFARVREIADDARTLVVVLVDEVESLSASRARAVRAGTEPADAVRAVNALLTQLDLLRARPNVLTVATSNITAAVDAAFLDRADLALRVPLPAPRARARILRSALNELRRIEVISGDWDKGARAALAEAAGDASARLSGRTLRKLPLLTLARCGSGSAASPIPLTAFINALARTAVTVRRQQQRLHHDDGFEKDDDVEGDEDAWCDVL